MSVQFISDDEVERALDYLRDNAAAIGEARKKAVLAERMVRHVKALEMKKCSELPVSAQEREAYSSEAYKQAALEEAEAAGEWEVMKSLREAAAMKIEAWRTISSTIRSMKV